MLSPFNILVLALVLFVGGHFFLSSLAMRTFLIARLGLDGFRILYSAYAGICLVFLILAWRDVPYLELWRPAPILAWVPFLLMPLSTIFVVAGATTRNPISTRFESGAVAPAARGIIAVTRHPILWGVALWGFSHLFVAGDVATVLLIVGLLILTLGGMVHIDLRREQELGSRFGPIRMTTSLIPFLAILTRRNRFDWAGIGWGRVLGGLGLYLVLLLAHAPVLSKSAFPF